MKKKRLLRFALFVNILIHATGFLCAQEPSIQIPKKSILLSETFEISYIFPHHYKREYLAYKNHPFPNIVDLAKGRTIYSFSEDQNSYIITQIYYPLRSGNIYIPPFNIEYGKNQKFVSLAFTLSILHEGQPADISADENIEYEEEKPDAFLKLFISNKNVYKNQGFNVVLGFCIEIENEPEVTFFDLYNQNIAIIKSIKPINCFSENIGIADEIESDTISQEGKKYIRWKLFEGVFYPIDSNDVIVSPQVFKTIIYKKGKDEEGNIDRIYLVKEFSSLPVKIKVKPLPPHPLHENVITGVFQLQEEIYPKSFRTGNSFRYKFSLVGTGNTHAINGPYIENTDDFDVFYPKITEEYVDPGKTIKRKTFTYYIIPKEPGLYTLRDRFYWIYFNYQKEKYDTLRSNLSINIKGESLKNNYISLRNQGSFYSAIDEKEDKLDQKKESPKIIFFANLIILLMLASIVYITLKR